MDFLLSLVLNIKYTRQTIRPGGLCRLDTHLKFLILKVQQQKDNGRYNPNLIRTGKMSYKDFF